VIDVTDLELPTEVAAPEETSTHVNHLPDVCIVVPTAGRPVALARCVKSLLSTGYPNLEVLVVDNRPDPVVSESLQALVAGDTRIRYLTEDRSGASKARNTGLAAANAEYVGFVDDDIEVDRWWLHHLTAALTDLQIDCVTSLLLPARLDTRAQRAFEEMKGFSRGTKCLRFGSGLRTVNPREALAPGRLGPGGCALWRRSAIERLGGFEPMLGPGTPSRAGEDLYLFLRLIREGGCVMYAPDAVAWHDHTAEWADLRSRMRGYGAGLMAMMLLHVLRRPDDLVLLARALPGRLRQVVFAKPGPESGAAVMRRDRVPRSLVFDQLCGLAYGPIALARSALRERRAPTEFTALGRR
jgi:GT2 family glycosyltransferase